MAVAALPAPPGLAVILVGDRPDSRAYVRMKKKACVAAGIADFGLDFPADVSQEELLAAVANFNADERVHGILVQLPLPPHIDEAAVINAVDVAKDVDGLHPLSFVALAATGTHQSSSSSSSSSSSTTYSISFSSCGHRLRRRQRRRRPRRRGVHRSAVPAAVGEHATEDAAEGAVVGAAH